MLILQERQFIRDYDVFVHKITWATKIQQEIILQKIISFSEKPKKTVPSTKKKGEIIINDDPVVTAFAKTISKS